MRSSFPSGTAPPCGSRWRLPVVRVPSGRAGQGAAGARRGARVDTNRRTGQSPGAARRAARPRRRRRSLRPAVGGPGRCRRRPGRVPARCRRTGSVRGRGRGVADGDRRAGRAGGEARCQTFGCPTTWRPRRCRRSPPRMWSPQRAGDDRAAGDIERMIERVMAKRSDVDVSGGVIESFADLRRADLGRSVRPVGRAADRR